MRYPALVTLSCVMLGGHAAKDTSASNIGRKRRDLIDIGAVASDDRVGIALEKLLTDDEEASTIGRYLEYSSILSMAITPSYSPTDFPTFSHNTFPASTPTSTQSPLPVTTTDPVGTTAPSDFCFVQVSVTCTPPSNFEDCDSINEFREECFEKPFSMGFRYNGGDCSQEFNDQSPLIYHCEDYNGGPPVDAGEESYIVVTDIMGRGVTFFEGIVPVGGLFQVDNPDPTLQLQANINVTIYNSDALTPGNIRQTMIIHTSCSQATFLKDRYGAAELLWFNNTIQGNTTSAIDLNLGFEVTNVAEDFNVDLVSLTSVTNFPGHPLINLTNKIAGETLRPGQTIPLNFTVSLDTSIRQRYTSFSTIQASTFQGLSCRNTEFLNFTAGNTNTAPFFNLAPAPSAAPAIPQSLTSPPSSNSPSSLLLGTPTPTTGKIEPPTQRLPTVSCPAIPQGGCSICGDNSCVRNPDAIFSFPDQPTITCGDLQKAAEEGLVPLEQCAFLPSLVSQICECQVPAPSAPVQAPIAPTSSPSRYTPSPMLMPTSESPLLSNSFEPTYAPILMPIAPVFSCPEIPQGGCSICGDNSCVRNPDAIFSFPDQPTITCGDLQEAAEEGLVPLEQCAFLPSLISQICECQVPAPSAPVQAPIAPTSSPSRYTPSPMLMPTSESPLLSNTFEPTYAPILMPIAPVFSCPEIPQGGCSICGDNSCVRNPDAIFSFPDQPTITCGDLQEAAEEGLVPLEQCAFLPSLVSQICECQVPAPSAPVQAPIAPTSSPSRYTPSPMLMPTSESPLLSNSFEPTYAPILMPIAPVFSCPEIPQGGCSICGDNSCVRNPDAIFSFPDQPTITCGDLQKAAEEGLVPLEQCAFLPSLVSQICECQVPAPSAPVQAPIAPTSSPSRYTPSPMLMPTSESPLLSNTFEPTYAPILMPIAPVFSCPEIPQGGCSICGDNSCVRNPDAIFSFPDQPTITCGDLQKAAEEGLVPLEQCAFLPSLVSQICECQVPAPSAPVQAPIAPTSSPSRHTPSPMLMPTSESPMLSNTFEPTYAPILMPIAPVFSCPEIPQGGCSICGDNSCVRNPDAIFSFPDQPTITCGDLQKAAEEGLVPLEQCAFLPSLVSQICECQVPAPSAPVQAPIAPTSSPSRHTPSPMLMPTSESPMLSNTFEPTYAPILMPIAPVFSCPEIPQGGCSICGDNSCVRNPDAIFSFPDQPTITCGDLQEAAEKGLVPLEQCAFLPSLVSQICECQVPAPSAPVQAPIAPTSSPSRHTPSPMLMPTSESPLLSNTFESTDEPILMPIAPVFSCPEIPQGGCSICGDNSCVRNPDAIFSIAGQPEVACGDLQKAAEKGLVPLEQCAFLPNLVYLVCECQGPPPSAPAKALPNAPTSTPSCHTPSPMVVPSSESHSISIILEPTDKAPSTTMPVTQLFSCPEIAKGGCSICGENKCVSNPHAMFIFPGQPQVACGNMQKAGYDGDIHPDQCSQLPVLVHEVCQCQEADPSFSGIPDESLSMKAAVSVDDIHLAHPETNIYELYDLLASVSLQGGEEFTAATSYQSKAMVWLSKHSELESMDNLKKIQRYALACIYFNTYSVTTPYTKDTYVTTKTPGWIKSTDWLNSNVDECEWFGVGCNSNNAVSSIELSNNRLTGSLPPEIILLKESLIRLDISNNSVWNAGYEGNAFLGELTQLEYLNYGSTNFQHNDGIPMHIGMLTNLIEYNCSYTLYRGALKGDVFRHLSSLNHLAIGGNSYNSAVPMELGQYLPDLAYLYIEHADLTGDLSFIANLTSIKELWLDMNPKLKGHLPSTLGGSSLPHLKSLSISNCGLTGSIPSEVGSMMDLQQLWLYGNHLTGHIPTELGNLIHLHTLELENNAQSGAMPTEICFNLPPFGSLKVLQADCNKRVSCSCCTSCY